MKKLKTQQKSNIAQFFLAHLLVPLTGDLPCFCIKAVSLADGLIVGLAIDNVVLIALNVAVGLL